MEKNSYIADAFTDLERYADENDLQDMKDAILSARKVAQCEIEQVEGPTDQKAPGAVSSLR